MSIQFKELQKTLPPEYTGEVKLPDERVSRPIVVLDDDPTGCQTLHGVPVTFSWEKEVLRGLFNGDYELFFILTNSRSMPEEKAVPLTREVVRNVKNVAAEMNCDPVIVSRSDSTLRGHYPAEVHAIEELYPDRSFMHCFIPAFFQGGRFTVEDVHYVKEGDLMVPASETPFAEDKIFGFKNSNLKAYISEKTGGRIAPHEVLSFSLDQLRSGGPDAVSEALLSANNPVCIVNAFNQKDLDVFAVGAWNAMLQGKDLLFRTAASFLNSLGGIPVKNPLNREALSTSNENGGLIVAGSYVPKTTSQLNYLVKNSRIYATELSVRKLISDDAPDYIEATRRRVDTLLSSGKNVMLFTSRELFSGSDAGESLEIGEKISQALVEIVARLNTRPAFIVTKGGITSHEIAKSALKIEICKVDGQALPGIPVLSSTSQHAVKYVIFPGNVGEEKTLYELYNKISGS